MPPRSKPRPIEPINPQPSVTLQSISDQRRLSEQPEDLQSIHTPPDDLDPEPTSKGKGRQDPLDDEPDDTPDEDPQDDNEDRQKFFKKLLHALDKPNVEPPRAKVRDPEVYDGNDQAKLRTFFLQCMLNFRDRPKAFATGATKVQYAISYLSGPALQYFEPAILGEIIPEPIWLQDWDSFRVELETNFGPFDNAAQAEIELEKIIMKEHHKAARYFIEFARASTRTQWNDAALRHFAYRGLAKRIKDDLLHFPRYKSLAELRNFALEIDSRYWERKEYDSISTPSKTSHNTNANRSSPQTFLNQQSNQGSSKKNRGKNSSSKSSNSASTSQEKTPDISSKLGKDGKLLPEERQRRIDQGLCLLCGTKGHLVKECPKSTTSSKPATSLKARSTKSNTVDSASTTTESKK
jgi:Retrotransposon gag protein